MRIAISALHIRPGRCGSHEAYLTSFVSALARAIGEHECDVLVGSDALPLFANGNSHVRNVRIRGIARSRITRAVAEQLYAPVYRRRYAWDVVHYAGTAASLWSRHSDVVTIHHDSRTQRASMSAIRNRYYDVLMRVARRTGVCVVPTHAYKRQLEALFPSLADQLHAIPHGTGAAFYAVGRWRSEAESLGNGEYVLSVTNSLPHKNLAGLVRGYAQARRLGLDIPLVIVGAVTRDDIRQCLGSDRTMVEDCIELLGRRTHDEVADLHRNAACAAFVSTVETFGMPVSEAMAANVPVVASDIDVHREVGGDAPSYVCPGDWQMIARSILDLCGDSSIRRQAIERGAHRAAELTWDRAAEAHMQLYERVRSSC